MAEPLDDAAIEAIAAAWIAQRDDGLSQDQEREFTAWRAADPRREAAVMRLERTWCSLQRLRDFRPEARAHPDHDVLVRPRRRRPVRLLPWCGALASMTVALVAAVMLFKRDFQPVVERVARTYTTMADGFQRVNLPDGSVVTINGGSELRVVYAADERRVNLLRGEAHFVVAKDPRRPFWVEAGSMTVRAVGTAFNVRLASSEVEVLVTEGRVQVDDTRVETEAIDAEPETAGLVVGLVRGLETVLDAGERLKVALDGLPAPVRAPPVVEKLAPSVVREHLAWQEAWLVFAETPLRDAVDQFNARNGVRLVIEDAALGEMLIGGTFRVENVDGFVRLLEASSDVHADRSSPDRIVLRPVRDER